MQETFVFIVVDASEKCACWFIEKIEKIRYLAFLDLVPAGWRNSGVFDGESAVVVRATRRAHRAVTWKSNTEVACTFHAPSGFH
jgi:hypothetical protein